ncbi:hypothetical protein ACWENQ_40385 [Nonomuraea sp. NPDC004354]
MADAAQQPDQLDGLAGPDQVLLDVTQIQTLQQLASVLRLLQARSGLSLRALADRTKLHRVRVARETAGKMLRGERLASKAVTLALVRQLGVGDDRAADWDQAWERVFLFERGSRTAPPRGEVTELRQLVTELEAAVHAQQQTVEHLQSRLNQLQQSPRPSRSINQGGGGALMLSATLHSSLERQLSAAAPQVAQQAAQKLVEQVIATQFHSLETVIRRELTEAGRQAAMQLAGKLVDQIAAASALALEGVIRRELEQSARQATREAVDGIVGELL